MPSNPEILAALRAAGVARRAAMTEKQKTRRDQVINMRAKRRDVDLIDTAAERQGITRSAFILQHALAEARSVIREAENEVSVAAAVEAAANE